MIDYAVNELALVKDICESSFYEFVKEFWDTIIQEDPIWNWHIEYLCNELQTIAERVFRGEAKAYDEVINISPGTTKSTICSVMFPAWVWTRMPSARFICASYSQIPVATDLSVKCRDVVESDKYKEIWPDIRLRADQNTKSYFVNTKGGYRYATSVGGSVMGMHGHFLVIDDPINPAEAISEADLATANRWMSETLPTRKVDKAVSVTILIMQRLHQNDPSGVMIEKAKGGKRNIRHICLPAEISDVNRKHVKPKKLVARYVDGLMDPVRLSRTILDEQLDDLLPYGYAGQFLQHPVPLGGGLFKFERVKRGLLPDKFKSIVRYWDKAGTLGGGAYTVGAKLGEDLKGRIWILDIKRGQWDTALREELILQSAQSDGKKIRIGVEQEPGSGGKESAENTVKNLRGFRTHIDRPTGDKALRAEPLSIQVNYGNVYIPEGAEWADSYLNEMQFFPNSKFKDQIDASSGAFTLLTKPRTLVGGLGTVKKTRGH